jgi:hypothetical protein
LVPERFYGRTYFRNINLNLREMKPERINQLIAEFAGWTCNGTDDGEYQLRNPGGKLICSDWDPDTTLASFSYKLPNCHGDLNAIHEAALKLEDTELRRKYLTALNDIACQKKCRTECFKTVNATAPQRAEALLKTIGKWEGE